MLDLPCGDFYWMKAVDLENCYYIGSDIVKFIIDENVKKHGARHRWFLHADVTKDALPCVDLIFCRDLFVHLSLEDIFKALRNFKTSGAKYLLTTTFVGQSHADQNSFIHSGGWRPVDLQQAPFNFPAPVLLINEQCTEQNGLYRDKSLGLWHLQDLPI